MKYPLTIKRTTLVGLVFGVASCLPAEPIADEPTPEPEEPKITASPVCRAELVAGDPFYAPTRTPPADLLAVQIYEKEIAGSTYKPYAYGCFDNWSYAAVELSESKRYKIEATLITDAKSVVRYAYGGYAEPFMAGADNTAPSNAFAYTSAK